MELDVHIVDLDKQVLFRRKVFFNDPYEIRRFVDFVLMKRRKMAARFVATYGERTITQGLAVI